ncbi:MAG: hypothetical protein WCR23_14215 [Planctomycetota bacterium]
MSIGQTLLPMILLIGQLPWAVAESRQNMTIDRPQAGTDHGNWRFHEHSGFGSFLPAIHDRPE